MDNNNIIIAVCVLCLLMTLLFACSRGCSQKTEKKEVVTQPKIFRPEKEDKHYSENTYSSNSSKSSSYGKPPALLSRDDKERLEKKYKENREKINKLKKEEIEKQLKDPNLSPVAKEQIRLRTNPSFVKGMYAFNKQDYKTAINSFNEIVKDPNTTPISKYFACSQLMEVAKRMKDLDLYFIAARMRAKLEAEEDLSMLGVEKGTFSLEWCAKVENSLRAKNDPKYFDICVELKLANATGEVSPKIRRMAEEEVKKDIKFYSKQFKELIE